MVSRTLLGILWITVSLARADEAASPKPAQYAFAGLSIPAASADEPLRKQFSLGLSVRHMEEAAQAWSKDRQCISCHTNGSYLLTRPALTVALGTPPSSSIRDFFIDELDEFEAEDRQALRSGLKPTQVAYLAAGLAEWDRHVTKTCSPETDRALRLMLEAQAENGSFRNLDCWPPLESSAFHGTTVAAMATAAAPGWQAAAMKDPLLAKGIDRMHHYLQQTRPPNDYAQVLLLWTSARVPGLISESRQTSLIDLIWEHQRPDGGWSLRDFGTPETWGSGNRADKLRAEPEFTRPPSDGHMTGLAVLTLREAGIAASDPRIQRAVSWLKANQRESGRWWTRSLNTDKSHFITYSGTCYPLLALAYCHALP